VPQYSTRINPRDPAIRRQILNSDELRANVSHRTERTRQYALIVIRRLQLRLGTAALQRSG
jgi:hypothetical protein